jgi:hypothetical protein
MKKFFWSFAILLLLSGIAQVIPAIHDFLWDHGCWKEIFLIAWGFLTIAYIVSLGIWTLTATPQRE